MTDHSQILMTSYENRCDCSDKINPNILNDIKIIAAKSFTQKGVFTVIITLLAHKIYDPKQDIRNHQANMVGGFSGRSIDTRYITPYLKKIGLPSMAESGWLTRSLEQPYPYTLEYNGKISGAGVKGAFLNVLDALEKKEVSPDYLLKHLLYDVDKLVRSREVKIVKLATSDQLTIRKIETFLDSQFSYNYGISGGSKLPVIALQALYSLIVAELKRYEKCTLKELGSHTASDKTSRAAGDIEVLKGDALFEAIEVKLGKPIDEHMVRIAQQKIYDYNPQRYYILSDAGITDAEANRAVIKEVRQKHGCQIILNGLLPTIKYYLRLVSSLDDFVGIYLDMVEQDTELQKKHKDVCNQLIKEHLET
jgi:DNA (cytosine-5)-methyltransferase 1